MVAKRDYNVLVVLDTYPAVVSIHKVNLRIWVIRTCVGTYVCVYISEYAEFKYVC